MARTFLKKNAKKNGRQINDSHFKLKLKPYEQRTMTQ